MPTAVGKSPPRLSGHGPLAPGERRHPARRPSWSSLTKPSRLIEQHPTHRLRGESCDGSGSERPSSSPRVAFVAFVGSAHPTRSDQQHEPAPRTRDDIVRDLVARGVVPAATLDDGTQITGPGSNRHHAPAMTSSAISSRVVSFPPPRSTTERRSPVQVSDRHHAPAMTSSAISSRVVSFRPPPSTTGHRSPAQRSNRDLASPSA